MQKTWVSVLLVLCSLTSFSQLRSPNKYPVNYFRNPLEVPMELSANFGELRPNHWHMGLDIRTEQKENLPVYAAAEGYISRISIQPGGFGRSISIRHPNGLTTLYGHLNDFFPALENYVKEQQYKLESWEVDLVIPENLFPVEKGSFIAYSGNTGASQGPHVHFEIRDTKTGKCLNPLLFQFPIADNVPPAVVRLAMYDRSRSVYEQSPQLYALKNTDSGYIIPKVPVIITGSGKISFAIQAYDRLSGSTNPNGIYEAVLLLDNDPIIEFVIDSIDYNETRYMNAQIDYKERHSGRPFLQHLSKMAGDKSRVYNLINGDGVINLNDTLVHDIQIRVKDAYMNTSEVNFKVQHSDSLTPLPAIATSSVILYPGNVNVLEKEDFEMYMGEDCMYDSVHIFYYRDPRPVPAAVSANHRVGDASIPVQGKFNVRIKPATVVTAEQRDKIVIRRNSGGRGNVEKAAWQNGWMAADMDEFGSFQAFVDLVPPIINELGKKDTVDLSPASRIVFHPTDNFGLKRFRVELDGKWLRFTNDKYWSYIYNFDEKCEYGIHELKAIAEDLVGNITTRSWWFRKYPYTPPVKKAVRKSSKQKKRKRN